MKIGLVGENVKNSYSKQIHESLLNENYELFSVAPNDINSFLKSDFAFLNVTIPYKKIAYQIADVSNELCDSIKASNLLVKQDGKIHCYNTDYYGFKALLKRHNVSVEGKNCLILGTGGSSETVYKYLVDNRAQSITFASRNPDGKENRVSYANIQDIYEVIINTTPIDTFEFDIANLKNLKVYIDIKYRNAKCELSQSLREKGVIVIHGLYMLVHQAILSDEIYLNETFDNSIYNAIYRDLLLKTNTLVIIGHPCSGKTTFTKKISDLYGIKYVDIDEEIEKKEKKSISDIFKEKGEKYFRTLEKEMLARFIYEKAIIISTGGGIILDKENRDLIKRESIVINITRDVKTIAQNDLDNRPLISSLDDLKKLIQERKEIYESICDFTLDSECTPDDLFSSLEDIA